MNLALQHDMMSSYTRWCQGSNHRKAVKVPMCKCFTGQWLCHRYYCPIGQSHMTKHRNTVPLYVKEIYSETERIYGYFSSLLYFIFLSLVLFIYILWLLCGRCLISGYWMNERKSSWNRPSDSKAETPRHDMACTGHLYNLMVAAVLRPHSPDLQPDDDCFLYMGEEIR